MGYVPVCNGRKLICIIPEGDGEEMDARLIAAAPELLDALKAAIAILNSMGVHGDEPIIAKQYNLITSAIAKVKGE